MTSDAILVADNIGVRFETADTPPGPVRSFKADDPALRRVEPPAEA